MVNYLMYNIVGSIKSAEIYTTTLSFSYFILTVETLDYRNANLIDNKICQMLPSYESL